MKKNIFILLVAALTFCNACSDEEFLEKDPTNILTTEQVWSDRTLVINVLADLYSKIGRHQHLTANGNMGQFNEAFISRNGSTGAYGNNDWGFGEWGTWDYSYIRELNLFIERASEAQISVKLTEADKAGFLAEGRFLRAYAYFNMVKRMGGVPIITSTMLYDYSGDATNLQVPRSKEHEVYDFVIAELDEIQATLPDNPNNKSRATKGAALALQSRVALYAASIAKYGASRPELVLPGGETGIPASMANGYYEKALASAQAVTGYSLYLEQPDDLSENFANLFLDKSGNPETIFIEDFKLKHKFHNFTVESQPFSMTEESFGGLLNPSLNLVMEFEKLDNTFEPLQTGDNVFYAHPLDLFANRDARLLGTVMAPGSMFKGRTVDIWAGYMLSDKSIITSTDFGSLKRLPGKDADEIVVGKDGPIPGKEYTAQTGFYIRKFLDPTGGAGSLGTQSEVPWIYIRYAEVLLNAAEAAFELGFPDVAAGYMNQVRQRAGFTTGLGAGEITFDRIVHERKMELAFEDHLLWDMKRWRLADKVWNGSIMSEADLKSNLGEADKPMTQVFALMPYKYYAPGAPEDGSWVFTISKPNAVTGADRFRAGNYYSRISDQVIANNPKIVQNPNN
ncbi:MAG TPA: RagB/SusD family nutrient uptake outer membrane protein [Cytophagales bacterium]|nr:RagB/SusD family nutrient uptake outer membrane protein [Cytophagales bacterium]